MKNICEDLGRMWGLNGAVCAYLTLADVKDLVAVGVGLVTIVSTLVLLRNNLRKGRK